MSDSAVVLHFKKLKQLLKIERDEDFRLYKEQFLRADINERRKNGLTWYPIVIHSNEIGFGDYLQIEIERTSHLGLPHQFSSGKNVSLFSNRADDTLEMKGTIKAVYKDSMKIILSTDELPDWAYEGKLGINAQFDDNSYDEMEHALDELISGKNKRALELAEIFHGAQYPEFSTVDESLLVSSLNLSQNRAVRKVLSAVDVAVIHGPPGTGKTTTFMHCIRLCLQSEKQVLVCAPTNTAVDHLTEKLREQGIRVLRLGHPARVSESLMESTVDGQMQGHENYKDIKSLRKNAEEYFRMAGKYKRTFGKEDAKQRALFYTEAKNCLKEATLLEDYIIDSLFQQAQVIACTPVTAVSKHVRNKKFATLFFDEASQALEPMSWIPLLKCQRIILAGDHFQLPPVVKSKQAEAGGLKNTLLDICMKKENISCLLTLQYRMHSKIMKFSNDVFYEGKLEADMSVKDTLLSYADEDDLLQKPIEFIDTAGCGFSEKVNSETLSLRNEDEAGILFTHLRLLFDQVKKTSVSQQQFLQIGIITPYKEQLEYLSQQIKEQEFYEDWRKHISIKTIDGFQGEERDIMYISFVRSNDVGEIGFLQDIRRTNVAMTRAKRKLVMIGDSATLSSHDFYKSMIEYCENEGGYSSAWSFMGY